MARTHFEPTCQVGSRLSPLEPTFSRTHLCSNPLSRTHFPSGFAFFRGSGFALGSRGFAKWVRKTVGSQWVRVGSRKVGSRKGGFAKWVRVFGPVGSEWVRAPWPSGNSLVSPQPWAGVRKSGLRGRRGCARHPDRWHGEQVQRTHRPPAAAGTLPSLYRGLDTGVRT